MKLVGYEWYKILKNRVFVMLLLLLSVVNLLWFCIQENHLPEDILTQNSIEQQIKYQKNYATFLGEMEERMQKMLVLSAFGKKEEFSHQNIKKTVNAYKGLENIVLETGDNLGVTRISENAITDVLSVFLVFLLCMELFWREKQEGTLDLLRSKKMGRRYLAICKGISLYAGVTVIGGCLYGGNLLFCGQRYGYDKPERFVQSIPFFQNTVYALKIRQYLYLYFGLKIAALLVIASVAGLLFLLFSKRGYLYVAGAVLLGTEAVLFMKIPDTSSLNYLKYVNLFYLLKADDGIKHYCNLNILGHPVEKNICCLMVSLILVALFWSLGIKLCANRKETKTATRLEAIWKSCKSKGLFTTCNHTNLLVHESYKCFFAEKSILLCLVLCLGCIWVIQNATEPFQNQLVQETYCSYMRTYAGPVTQDKMCAFYLEGMRTLNSLDDIYEDMEEHTKQKAEKEKKTLNVYGVEDYYKIEGFEEMIKQYRAVREKKPADGISLVNQYACEEIFLDSGQDLLQMLGSMICIVFFASVMFSSDYKNQMDGLMRTMKNGRSVLYRKRVILMMVLCVYCFVVVYLPEVWYILRYYGKNVLQGQLCDIPQAMALGKQPIPEAWVWLLLLRFCLLFFWTSGFILFSWKCKNGVLTMLSGTGIVVLLACLFYRYPGMRIGNWLCRGQSRLEIIMVSFVLLIGSILFVKVGSQKNEVNI